MNREVESKSECGGLHNAQDSQNDVQTGECDTKLLTVVTHYTEPSCCLAT